MSTEIDQRVVEMKFDNKNFEKNVSTSMSTLKRFQESLKFKGATKGIEEVQRAAKHFEFGGLTNAIGQVEMKFNAMSLVAVSAMNRIVSTATDAGVKLVKSLSVDNIAAGWQKFADKTTSVGTLVAQGYDIDTVTKQLNKLNWFTDETSYNFVDMVSNIAKFTAAGKDLQSSVVALEGIANWAALSGQNAGTASRAMYQISQAMGAGVMRKEDWKSIQNVSMDTDEFRQHALDAAVALKTLKKNADGTYQSLVANTKSFTKAQFAEHLTQDAWFTSDVMMQVFSDYSAAVDKIYSYAEKKGITASEAIEALSGQLDEFAVKAFRAAQEARTWGDVVDSVKDAVSTGWMNTFELIFGNYEEAKTLFTDLANEMYDVFAEGGNERNRVLREGLTSGWSQLIREGIPDAEKYKQTVLDLAKAQGKITETEAAEYLEDFDSFVKQGYMDIGLLEDSVAAVTKEARLYSDEQLKSLGYTEDQITDLRLLSDAYNKNEIDFERYEKVLAQTSGRELLVQSLWNLWDALFKIDEESEKAIGVFAILKDAWESVFPPATGDTIHRITERIAEFTEKLIPSEETAEKLSRVFKGFVSVLDILKQIASAVWRSLSPVFDLAKQGATWFLDLATSVGDSITNFAEASKETDRFYNAIQSVVSKIRNATASVKEFLGISSDKTIFGVIQNIFSWIIGAFKTIGDKVKSVVTTIKESGLVGVLQSIWNVIKKIAEVVKTAVMGLLSAIGFLGENGKLDLSKIFDVAGTGVLAAIGLSLKKFIDSLSGAVGKNGVFGKIKGVLDSLRETLEAFQARLKSEVIKNIAISIGIMAASLLVLSMIPIDRLLNAVAAMSALLGIMSIMMKKTANMKVSLKAVLSMIPMATALILLSASLKILGGMEWDQIAKGLAGIAGAMTIMIIACKVLSSGESNYKSAQKAARSMFPMAVALLLLSASLKIIGNMEWEQIGKGLTGMAGVMAIMVASVALISVLGRNAKNGIEGIKSLIPMAAAMLLFTASLKILGNMEWDQIANGLKAMAGVMAIMVGSIALISMLGRGGKQGIKGIKSMLAMSAAMLLFTASLKILGNIEWDKIETGLIAMGGVMAIMVASLAILSGLNGTTGGLLKSAAAIAILSASLLLLIPTFVVLGNMSLDKIFTALIGLAAALGILVAAAIAAQGVVPALLAIGAAVALLGVGVAGIGVGIGALATGLGILVTLGPLAGQAMVTLLESIAMMLPTLAISFAQAIGNFAATLGTVGDQLITMAATIISSFCEGLVQAMPSIMAALDVLIGAVIVVLEKHIPDLVAAILTMIVALLNAIAERLPDIIDAGVSIIEALIQGIADAAVRLADAGFGAIITFINGLSDTIEKNTPVLVEAMKRLFMTILNAAIAVIEGYFDLFKQIGDRLMEIGFIRAIVEKIQAVVNAIRELITNVKNAIVEKYNEFKEAAGHIISGLIEGIVESFGRVVQTAKELGSKILGGIKDFLGIKSPSRVMRDEVGRYIVEGIAEGIKSDASAEEAAAKKAQNIVSAFKSELDKIDVQIKTGDLEQKLWDSMNTQASAEEKLLKNIEHQNNKLRKQAKKTMAAEAEYKATSMALGETAKETQEAYNKYLQEQITLREYAGDLLTLQASQIETAVKNNKVGEYVVEGIAYGITSNMSAEEAANKKAQNIVNAFKVVLDKFDMNMQTGELEYQVWEAANTNASSTEKMLKQIELLDLKLKNQAEKTMAAEAEYKATLASFGADSQATKDAYNKYLQEQLDMLNLANEMAAMQDKPIYARAQALLESKAATSEGIANESASFFAEDGNAPAMKIISGYMRDVDVVISGIEDAAEAGTDIVDENTDEITKIVNGCLSEVSVSIQDKIPEAITSSTAAAAQAASNAGKEAGTAFADSFINASVDAMFVSAKKQVYSGLDPMAILEQIIGIVSNPSASGFTGDSNSMLASVYQLMDYWSGQMESKGEEVGLFSAVGMANGMTGKDANKALQNGAGSMADGVINGVKEKLEIKSPSKVMEELGEYVVIGFAQGFLNMLHLIIQNAGKVADATVDTISVMMSSIDSIMEGDMNYTPMISPVLDLSGIAANASMLGSMLDANGSYAMASNAYAASDAARTMKDDARAQMLVNNLGRRIDALQYSLDDLRAVVEARGHGDLNVEFDVDGAQLARMTVPDYINASRAAGTPFYTPSTK